VDRGSARSRLAELKLSNAGLDRVFGAGVHGYALAAPLSEATVVSFETVHRVTLPDAYRAFLLHVGSEGAGPGYGLTGLPTGQSAAATMRGSCPLTRQDAEDVR
jgi:hypothetical protein